MSDDFTQVSNHLPYKQINSIKISSVSFRDGKFTIACECAIEGAVDDREKLERTWEDINWLIDNISSNKKTYLTPKINNQTYLALFYQKINTQHALSLEFEQRHSERMVERALVIITTVVLSHLKTLGDEYVYPIFIFFHKNFGLYKNPIYYKEELTPITQKFTTYLWGTYAMLSNKSVGWDEIQKIKTAISNQLIQFQQGRSKLSEYTSLLWKLQEEFIGEKEKIKAWINVVEKLLFSYENEVKYLELVVQQINQTLVKIKDRALVEQLMKHYELFLNQQVETSIQISRQLVKQYVQVMCQQGVRIKVTPH